MARQVPDPDHPDGGDTGGAGGAGRGPLPGRRTTPLVNPREVPTSIPGGTVDRTLRVAPRTRGTIIVPPRYVFKTPDPPDTHQKGPVLTPIPSDVTRSGAQRTATVHGASAVVSTIYGQINVGGQLVYRIVYAGKLLTAFIIGHGPISQVVGATVGGQPVAGFATTTYYTGTKAQTPDASLVSAELSWVSGLPGRAYAVVAYNPPDDSTPQFDPYSIVFEVKGLLVRDGRNNPPASTAATVAAGSSGALSGRYLWKFTFVDGSGDESPGSLVSAAVTVTSKQVDLSAIVAGPGGTASRKIYRTKAGTSGPFYLVGSIADNTTTTFTDNIADGSLGAEIPYVSTKRIYSNNPAWVIADYLASKRYGAAKGDAAIDWLGSFKTAADICDVPIQGTGPVAAVAAIAAGSGALGAGTYSYKYAYVTANLGESMPSAKTNTITSGGSDRGALTGIVPGPTGTRYIRLFRTAVGNGNTGPWKQIELLPPSTTSWTDGRPDSDLGGDGPQTSGDVPRYTINIALQDRASPTDVLDQLRGCCAGFLVYNNGIHQLFIDVAASATSFSFTDDPDSPTRNITRPPTFRLRNLSEVATKIIVNFVNALNGYKDDSAEDEDPNYVPDYDSRVVVVKDYRGISSYDQAKRIAKLERKRGKNDVEINARVFYDGLQVTPFDRVPIDSVLGGITGKSWRILNVQQDGQAWLLQGQVYSDIYDDSLGGNPALHPAADGPGGGVVIRTLSAGAADTTYDSSAAGAQQLSVDETPSGTINGVNDTFTLAHTPTAGKLFLFVSSIGKCWRTVHYNISGATITFTAGNIPQTGDLISATYPY